MNQVIIDRALVNYGFLSEEDVAVLAASDDTRLLQCIVRCGGKRFTCSVQDVADMVAMIERDGRDYVRDVAFTADQCAALRKRYAEKPQSSV